MIMYYAAYMERPKINVIDELLINNDGFLLSTLGSEARRQFTEAVEQWGLGWQGQSTLTSLQALLQHGTVSQKQLADFVGIDPRNLVPIVDALERNDMIKRMPNPTDRRGYQLQLTSQGKTMTKQIYDARSKIEQRMFAGLTMNERKTLHKLLVKLWNNSDISQGFRVFQQMSHSGGS